PPLTARCSRINVVRRATLVLIVAGLIACSGAKSDPPPPPPPSPPTLTLAAQPTTVVLGSSTTLSWNSTNATSVTFDNGIGQLARIRFRERHPGTDNYLHGNCRLWWWRYVDRLSDGDGFSGSATPDGHLERESNHDQSRTKLDSELDFYECHIPRH